MGFLVTVAFLGVLTLAQGQDYVLKVVCDDITTIFVDGEQKNTAGTGVWNQLATLNIPASTGAIGIQCKNTGGPYGIMAQVADYTGNIFAVSDNTWKCSNQAQDGWAKSGFSEGETWKPAFYYTGQGAFNQDTGAWKGMAPNKKVIWTSTGDGTVYCRKDLPKLSGKPISWSKNDGKYLSGYSAGVKMYDTLAQAQSECLKRTDCGGITYETKASKKFTLRRGSELKNSPSSEISWKIGVAVAQNNILSKDFVATQNNVGWNGQPARALDGNTAGMWNTGTCTHTSSNTGNWWKVKLDKSYKVDKVVLHNRQDCCQNRINKASVFVGDVFCGEVFWKAGQNVYEIACGGAVGGSITVKQPYNYLTLCEVQAFGEALATDEAALTNVAKGKPATQSSVGWGGLPARGVDGKISGSWNKGTCTHSQNAGANWWQVDLQSSFAVDSVVIYNRMDCCQNRLNGAKVFVGETLCGAIEWSASKSVYRIDCKGASGSIVKVTQNGQYLTLCEVQVLAKVVKVEEKVNILSNDFVATQNNVGWNGQPARALDGNSNGQWSAGSCTHTSSNSGNWWKVKLDQNYKVDSVVLYNRQDCCQDRINKASVYVGAVFCGEVTYQAGQNKYEIACGGAVGGSITVKQPYNYLTLCEVQAFGAATDEEALINIALEKSASQSSVGWGGLPARAVDGRISGTWNKGTCTHSQNAASNWWMVDLVSDHEVDSVVIHNRMDCCQNRINGAKVFVGETLCGAVEWAVGKSVWRIDCKGASGSEVKITQEGQYLTLCEVQVLAKSSGVEEKVNILSNDLAATQNNVGWNGQPGRALDGNTDGKWSAGTCTHTSSNTQNWWTVQLDQNYKVDQVILYNREDCCQNRINGAKVYVGAVLCGEVTYLVGTSRYKIECGGAVGGSITVRQPYNYLTLCEVEAFGAPTEEVPLKNVGKGKIASQSSVGWNGMPARAVDGRISGTWNKGTCTHSQNAGSNWWKVDLEASYDVASVIIYNRADCCQNRLNGAKVFVGETLCGAIEWVATKSIYTIDCKGASGSEVKVTQEGQYLTLCEVEILAPAADVAAEDVNILSKDFLATQNNVGWNGQPARALDGNVDGAWSSGTCTHTSSNTNNWWKVKLDQRYSISKVALHNRQDCCQDRINRAKVYVGAVYCGEVTYKAGTTRYEIDCGGAVGNIIEVKQPYNYLTLCEVQAFGEPSTDEPLANVALGKTATQSSVGWGGLAPRGNDGSISGTWNKGTCTHSQNAGDNWWQVDLEADHEVDSVIIYNRMDCCQNRLNGAKVFVGDTLCGAIEWAASISVYRIDCKGASGSIVKVTQSGQYLTLCEVQVLAQPVEGVEEEDLNILRSDLTVSQNNVGWNGQPGRALDGKTDGKWSAGTCTHTSSNTGNYWSVTLGKSYKVNKVVLYNREDCCQNRLNGAMVYVGAYICGQVFWKAGQSVYEIPCAGAVGGSITVRQPYNYLTLCEVKAYGEPTDEAPLKNVAEGMPTWSSGVGWGGVASRAVDGRISGTWNKGTCTHSANAGSNQWRVSLMDQYDVDSVVIYNRVDCCQNRINGAKVYVGEELCGTVEWIALKNVYRIGCNGLSGNKVRITQEGQYLTLCEVQVIAKPSEDLGALINIAESGTASQSNVGWGGIASRAIDGNIASKYNEGSCSHTGNVAGGWWNLEFPEPVPVSKVVIYNRMDCCQDRIDGVMVYADDLLCGKIKYLEAQDVYKVGCNSDLVENVIAKNIKIKAADKQYLTLCEVKVLSDPTVEVGDEHLVNLAYQKPTSQSSTGWGGAPGRAVDGKESGQWSKGTCTHTNGAGSWTVDMQDTYAVEKVWIKNRVDCCSNRIDGVKVYVGDVLCGTIKYNPLKYAYTVMCDEGHGVVGQKVTIKNEKTHLTLCEVKVWGPSDPVIEGLTEDDELVDGDKSEAIDDKTSTATCPVGKVVRYCEVQTGKVGAGSDGALVKNNGADCVAHNGYQGTGVIARAFCTASGQVEDPCNGPKLLKYKYLYAKGASPSLDCPAGYEKELCNAHSFWWKQLTGKGMNDKGVIPNDKPCAVPSCSDANWCDVSLVCKLMEDMDAYAAKVCPDCEGYTCADTEECKMVDAGDSDSEKKVPTCVEKQTGCDIDRCGDHGECEAVGAEDYTCDCEDGYEFDEVAGTCMPKHSKYETVYGEKAIGDDAASVASCKKGQKVMRCHTFGAPSAADGVLISSEGGIAKCTAKASHSKKFPIMAVAYCGDDSVMTDPCTQDEIHGIEYRSSKDKSPSVSCPGGYLMESCIFHSPWSQSLSDVNKARINSIGAVDINDDGSCSMANCLKNPAGHQFCTLTAVCKKLTGSEYLKAACPTCDDVRCPEGQECQMVKELPACLPRIPGGCEEDKCGKGECVEDGADYECLCDEGYKFDGETCKDVDECAEGPCGNGECTNTPGSYTCVCDKGYELTKGTCEDINECLDSPCSDTERCSNVEGSFICDCLDTFVKNRKTKQCECADGFENKDGECVDIDECQDNPCGENEVCTNEVGNYHCDCKEGTSKGEDGTCQEFKFAECGIKAKKSKIKGFKGTNVNVKLVGEKKKVFKKYAKITWTKNNEPWKPKDDGKAKINGFMIKKFDVDDVGVYVGSIVIDMDGEVSKCEVEVETILLEGSVTLNIANEADLMKRQKAGKELKIKCELDVDNVKLPDPKSPDNVNWYRVTDDGDVLLDDSDTIAIERSKGTYQLVLKNPTPEDSGTYRCEFDQLGLDAAKDVTIEVK